MTFVRHHTLLTICVVGEDFIEGFWDGSEWLYMIIWGVLPGLAAAASRFEYQGQLYVASKNLKRLYACSSDMEE